MIIGISFVAEPRDIEAICGQHNDATFPCQFEGSNSRPQWVINSTVYSSIQSILPLDHYIDSHALSVTNVKNKNRTTYQCQLVLLEQGRLCAYKSVIGQLIFRCPEGKSYCWHMHPLNNYYYSIGAFTFQSSPYYNLNSTKLDKIQTTISQVLCS